MQDWEAAAQAALEKKAENVILLDIGKVSSLTGHFVVATGTTTRQTQAIADGILDNLRGRGLRPLGVEGMIQGEWILMDYGYFLVHIFTPEKRGFYDLERLWSNAPRTTVSEAA
jgi:ribosome-associated protein